jgi:N-acetylgalactosamine-6-sulfatase
MRIIIFFGCLLYSALSLSAMASQPKASSGPPIEKPNIIFIFADDWGYGDLSLRGHPSFETPHLDQLAAEGTDFREFTVSGPVCSPSRAAVMTGQYPARHSVHRHFASLQANANRGMPDWLDPTVPQLPRLLQQAGYATGHFGKWHLTNVSAKDAPLPTEYGYDAAAVFNGPGPQANPANSDVDDKALAFIEKYHDRPFFINLWLHETHTAHFPKEAYMKQFAHLDEFEQVYAAILAEGDDRVGRILAALDAHGLTENTLVIFSSDNGPERQRPDRKTMKDYSYDGAVLDGYATAYSVGSSGGLRGRKRSLYEGGIRVPFIVRWPAQTPAGQVNTTSVMNAVDLLPTFLEIAGIDLPDAYEPDGQSILPALRGEEWQRSQPIFWETRGGLPEGDNWPRMAIRDRDWKLLMDFEGKRIELYNIPDDPSESKNLASEYPERVAALRAQLEAWKASLPRNPPAHCLSKFR